MSIKNQTDDGTSFDMGLSPGKQFKAQALGLKASDKDMMSWKANCDLFLVFVLWYFYLLSATILWMKSPLLSIFLMFLCAPFIVSWMGYIRHELWHNYFPGLPNKLLYNFVAMSLFSDPQIYGIAHATHHKYLHTTNDLEFFCEGYEKSSEKRRFQFWFEFFLGNVGWEINAMFRFWKFKEFSKIKHSVSLVLRLAIFAVICFVVNIYVPGSWPIFGIIYVLSIWIGAVVTRHDQWIEHLGIIHNGNLSERIYKTRNLPDNHWSNQIWNMLNHNDPRGHYFHHAYPYLNLRDITHLKLPKECARTTIPKYIQLLRKHYRSL